MFLRLIAVFTNCLIRLFLAIITTVVPFWIYKNANESDAGGITLAEHPWGIVAAMSIFVFVLGLVLYPLLTNAASQNGSLDVHLSKAQLKIGLAIRVCVTFINLFFVIHVLLLYSMNFDMFYILVLCILFPIAHVIFIVDVYKYMKPHSFIESQKDS